MVFVRLEDIVSFPAFVGQEADDTGEVDASQQSHQNESLDNQPSIRISSNIKISYMKMLRELLSVPLTNIIL